MCHFWCNRSGIHCVHQLTEKLLIFPFTQWEAYNIPAWQTFYVFFLFLYKPFLYYPSVQIFCLSFFLLLYYSIQQSKKGWSTEIATFLPTAHTKHKKLLIEKNNNTKYISRFIFLYFYIFCCLKIYSYRKFFLFVSF